MPAPSTAQRKLLTERFIAVTNASKDSALVYLKNANYNLDAAINLYFSVKEGQPGNGGSGASEAQEKVKTALNQLFDSLLSDEDRSDDPDGNTMSAESIQEYIGALGASCLNYEMFVVLDILEAEVFGQISRAGFVKAWSRLAADPKYRVAPDMASHRKYVRLCIDRVAKEPDYFKQLYQRAFLAGREPNQKAVRMDYAIPFWGAMFDPSVRPWKSGGIDWVEVWGRYLQEKFCVEGKDGEPKWTRTVSKDLWSQTLAFADKSVKDPTLGFWSEDQAWPGIIDDFVVWCRETGLVPAEKADGMETD